MATLRMLLNYSQVTPLQLRSGPHEVADLIPLSQVHLITIKLAIGWTGESGE